MMTASTAPVASTAVPAALRPLQLFWLAGALFVVSAGYGALMPLLPGWLGPLMPGASAPEISGHVHGTAGFFVAAVVSVVSALVAEHTPAARRQRMDKPGGTKALP